MKSGLEVEKIDEMDESQRRRNLGWRWTKSGKSRVNQESDDDNVEEEVTAGIPEEIPKSVGGKLSGSATNKRECEQSRSTIDKGKEVWETSGSPAELITLGDPPIMDEIKVEDSTTNFDTRDAQVSEVETRVQTGVQIDQVEEAREEPSVGEEPASATFNTVLIAGSSVEKDYPSPTVSGLPSILVYETLIAPLPEVGVSSEATC
ncbi:hypothetical protein LWI29_037595 [Acer saccharum]|uniref:Uncharacterized protein n=1 Tax=Acer saccharum TaxID=4024 RepID=A0AA39RHV0_ACESA|nr:hypothetical protein LWI29_037595 [Acer saccharum]